VSPSTANDDAPETTAAQALAAASRLRDRIAVMDGPMFGAAVQKLAAETALAMRLPFDETGDQANV